MALQLTMKKKTMTMTWTERQGYTGENTYTYTCKIMFIYQHWQERTTYNLVLTHVLIHPTHAQTSTNICICMCLQVFRCASSCANHVTCMNIRACEKRCARMFPCLRAIPKAHTRTHMHARPHPEDSHTATPTSNHHLSVHILRAWDMQTVGRRLPQLTLGTPSRLMRTPRL